MSEKNEILGELYALRAGISAISMERDAVKQIEGEYESELKKLKDTLPSKNWKRPDKERELKEKVEKIEKKREVLLSHPLPDPDAIEFPPFKRSKRKLVYFTIFVICIALMVILPIPLWRYFGDEGLGFLLIPLVIGAFCLCLFQSRSTEMKQIWRFSNGDGKMIKREVFVPSLCCLTKRGYEKQIQELRHQARIDLKEWKRNEEYLNTRKAEVEAAYIAGLAEFDAEYEAKEARIAEIGSIVSTEGAPYIEKAEALYRSLEKQYKNLLDVRDWQNIDLIIFYLETGRADTLKEALPMVDQQNQANMIAGAIARAAEEISYSIRRGLAELRGTMIHCFATLSDQLTVMQRDISGKLDGMNSNLQSISASVDFDNALRAKANADSMALMADVRHMRVLAESADANRRFGTP